MKEFYTYCYLNPTKSGRFVYKDLVTFFYEPFYVGKGKDRRLNEHIRLAKNTKRKFYAVLTGLKNANLSPIIIKVIDNIEDDEAKSLERIFISCIGRADLNKGPLTNLTDGGEGISNCAAWNKGLKEKRPDVLEKLRLSHIGQKPWNKDLSGFRAGRKVSQETKRKMSEAATGRKASLETRNKLSNATKKTWKRNPEIFHPKESVI